MNVTSAEKLLEKLSGVKACGNGWSALCPAHEDRRPSLSVNEGDDGRVLVKCHAGCTASDVCAAVGLSLADIMPAQGRGGLPVISTSTPPTSTEPAETRRKQGLRRRSPRQYENAEQAVAALVRTMGRFDHRWNYHNAAGELTGVVLRWDCDNGKQIRPVSRREGASGKHWVTAGMLDPRPLYRLPELLQLPASELVFICEGEKAADAACQLGLLATTSAHGAQSPQKTDWSPLAGRQCVLLPDNDDAGDKYAGAVATVLNGLSPPATVKSVELPGLPPGGDMADWLESRPDASVQQLRSEVLSLTEQEANVTQTSQGDETLHVRQFPVYALPEPLSSFIADAAVAIGCDASYLALPLLTAVASAIGNTRRIQLKRGWSAPPIIWTAIVGESGTAKTPAFKLALKPFRRRQQKAFEEHAASMKEYEVTQACYEKEHAQWKRSKKGGGLPPVKPDMPHASRNIVADTTVEALAPLLLQNPRGLLLACDELAGWLGSFDRYAGGKGGDSSHWLSMYNGEPITVDRKTGFPPTIYVPEAAVCVTGGIQPGILKRALGAEHRESGLAARLLLTCPPRIAKRWTDADIDPQAERQLAGIVDKLYALQSATDEEGQPQAIVLPMTAPARTAWITFYNHHAAEQVALAGDLSAAWSKLEETAARLALLVHCIRQASGDESLQNASAVDEASVRNAIEMTEWFKHEARRVYSQLAESDEQRSQRQLMEWINRKGGKITARQLQQGNRRYTKAQAAEAALNDLGKAGHGAWCELPAGPRGGRSTRIFRLHLPQPSTQPPHPPEPASSVDVAAVSTDTQLATTGQWGEV